MDDLRHCLDCWWSNPHRIFWHRPRTDTVPRRPAKTLQAANLHCIFLHTRLRGLHMPGYRKCRWHSIFISLAHTYLQTHITEFSLSRKIAKEFPSDGSSVEFSPSSVTISLPTHTANLTTSISENVSDATLNTETTPLLYPKVRNSASSVSSSNDSREDDHALRSVNRIRLLLAISYASFSGIISGMCLLFAKSGVELLVLTLGGDNQFRRWETWMLVLGLIAFSLLQLWYLHKALILADPTLVCPCE